MIDILFLIFGGRKAREVYQEHTDAIIALTAAQRDLREMRSGRR